MTLTRLALAVGGIAALTACPGDKIDSDCVIDSGETGVCDTGSTGCGEYTGDTYVGIDASLCSNAVNAAAGDPEVYMGCDESSWWYGAWTVGWTGGADLNINQTGANPPWNESHPFPADSYAFDPDGWWDGIYLLLDETDTAGDVVEGSVTLYDCNQARIDTLTWDLTIYDAGGSEVQCGKWGHDLSSVAGCDDWSGYF